MLGCANGVLNMSGVGVSSSGCAEAAGEMHDMDNSHTYRFNLSPDPNMVLKWIGLLYSTHIYANFSNISKTVEMHSRLAVTNTQAHI